MVSKFSRKRDLGCGVWALHALLTGDRTISFSKNFFKQEEMAQLRGELAHMWSRVSDTKLWQQLFRGLAPELWSKLRKPTGAKKEEHEEPQPTTPKGISKSMEDKLMQQSPPKEGMVAKISRRARQSSLAGILKGRTDDECKLIAPFPTKQQSTGNQNSKEDGEREVEAPKKTRKQIVAGEKSEKKKQKKKEANEQQIFESIAMKYLSQLGVTYTEWQQRHYAEAPVGKACFCPAGGWKQLRQRIALGEQPAACQICARMLKKVKFSMDKFSNFLEGELAGEEDQVIQEALEAGPKKDQKDANVVEVKSEPSEAEEAEGPQKRRKRVMKPPKVNLVAKVDALEGFRMFEPGTHGKAYPIQCFICRKNNGKPVIFDGCYATTDHYLMQHIKSPRHRKFVSLREGDGGGHPDDDPDEGEDDYSGSEDEKGNKYHEEDVEDAVEEKKPCSGFQVWRFPNSRIGKCLNEFALYATFSTLHSAKDISGDGHKYLHDLKSNTYTIFHKDCEKFVTKTTELTMNPADVDMAPDTGDPFACCWKCLSFQGDKSLVRNFSRFYLKFCAARLLKSKLFMKESVEEILAEIKKNPVWMLVASASKELSQVEALSIPQLQNYVRTGWKCVPVRSQNEAYKLHIASVIDPIIEVSPHQCNRDAFGRAEKLAHLMTQGRLRDADELDLKLGCYVSTGILQRHPLLLGMLICTIEKLKREEKGIFNMKGLQLQDHEKSLVAQSGVTLAMATANRALLREFGMMFTKPRGNLDTLLQRSLPDAFMSFTNTALEQNAGLIERLFPPAKSMHPAKCQRRLVFGFDKTYMLRQMHVVKLARGKGLVGGCWRQGKLENHADEQDQSFIYFDAPEDAGSACLVDSVDLGTLECAGELLECLLWDPHTGSRAIRGFLVYVQFLAGIPSEREKVE